MPVAGKLPLAMSSAVHNLQQAIVDGKTSVTQLLRQTKLIAAKLDLSDVKEWCHGSDQKGPPRVEMGPFWWFKIPHLGFQFSVPTSLFLTIGRLCVELQARFGG